MTDEQKLVDDALEKFGGDRELAAVALGKALSTVQNYIFKYPELNAKWAGKKLLQPPPPIRPIDMPTKEEKQLIVALSQEDSLLAEGLDRLGLTPEEAATAYQMQQFHRNQFVESIQILGGSMTRICIKMTTQLEQVGKRLDDVRKKLAETLGPQTRKEIIEEEKNLMSSYKDMAEQIRRMFDTSQRAAMLQAMIKFRLSGRREKARDPVPPAGLSGLGRPPTSGRPGFQSGEMPTLDT